MGNSQNRKACPIYQAPSDGKVQEFSVASRQLKHTSEPHAPREEHKRRAEEVQRAFTAASPHHTLTKEMNLGEKRLSSELLSCGGSPLTTWVSWSNTLFHLG